MNKEHGMSKRLIVASLILGSLTSLSASALAGKRERDLMTNGVAPAVKEAEKQYQTSCGCALTITVDEAALTSMDELRAAKYIAGHVTDGAKKYCTDDASKKAVCQLKTLTIGKAVAPAKAGFTFKDGHGIATTDGSGNCSWEQMVRVLDK
jgi:hypothetical protein